MSADAFRIFQRLIWQKAVLACVERATLLAHEGLSLANRVNGWNVYCAATVPYLANAVLPGPLQATELYDALTTLFPTGSWTSPGPTWHGISDRPWA